MRHRKTIHAYPEGSDENIEVWNALDVKFATTIRGGVTACEEWPESHEILCEGHPEVPSFVTSWVAEALYDELGIDLEKDRYPIEVIDIEDDDVTVIH